MVDFVEQHGPKRPVPAGRQAAFLQFFSQAANPPGPRSTMKMNPMSRQTTDQANGNRWARPDRSPSGDGPTEDPANHRLTEGAPPPRTGYFRGLAQKTPRTSPPSTAMVWPVR